MIVAVMQCLHDKGPVSIHSHNMRLVQKISEMHDLLNHWSQLAIVKTEESLLLFKVRSYNVIMIAISIYMILAALHVYN